MFWWKVEIVQIWINLLVSKQNCECYYIKYLFKNLLILKKYYKRTIINITWNKIAQMEIWNINQYNNKYLLSIYISVSSIFPKWSYLLMRHTFNTPLSAVANLCYDTRTKCGTCNHFIVSPTILQQKN